MHSLRTATTETDTIRGDALNGCTRLMRAAAKKGKEVGDPPSSSVRQWRGVKDQGGTPKQGSA